jgi:hypothetical protein
VAFALPEVSHRRGFSQTLLTGPADPLPRVPDPALGLRAEEDGLSIALQTASTTGELHHDVPLFISIP